MSIPDFQALMLPVLQALADGKPHKARDITDKLATDFKLTEEERNALLPSGTQPVFGNRVGWARTYLKKSSLITSPKRGTFAITDEGGKVLAEKPTRIDMKYLERFPGYLEFRELRHEATEEEEASTQATRSQTPEELLEASHLTLRAALAHELLDRIQATSWQFFERLVVDLLVAMGYGGSRQDAGKAFARGHDEGIDGIIKEDKLGLDVVYVQAKRWKHNRTVGRPDVQAFVGSLEPFRARKGVFITTSTFSKDAREYAERTEKKVVLIDGLLLADLMIEHGVGVTPGRAYVIKKLDEDYFQEG